MCISCCPGSPGGLRGVSDHPRVSVDPMGAFFHRVFALHSCSESLLIALHLMVATALKNAMAPGARHHRKSPASDLVPFLEARRLLAQDTIDQREVEYHQKHSLRACAMEPGQSPHR